MNIITTMALKEIKFRIIETDYDKITIEDNTGILKSQYDDNYDNSSNLYNYIVVMSHNPDFEHDTTFIKAYKSWNSDNMKKTFSKIDIRNEMTYEYIQKNVLQLLTDEYGEFDDFTGNIRRYNPVLLTENKHTSVFGFDALKVKVDNVMKFINNMVDMLNKFYRKYNISFQLDEKMDSIDKSKKIMLSNTEFKNFALLKTSLLF